MVLLEKTIKIGDQFGKKYAGKYVFKSISWGKTNRLTEDCTSYDRQGRPKTNLKMLSAKLLLATLRECPQVITYSHLMDESDNGIPSGLGQLLSKHADQVNSDTPEETKN